MKRSALVRWLLFACTGLFVGCAGLGTKSSPALRVGVTPDYPPLVYMEGGKVVGVEVDLANRLGAALGRPVEFIAYKWDDLIPALLAGKIDIIMSGMAETTPRKVRVAFADPYMRSCLVAAVQRADVDRFKTKEDILRNEDGVGVLAGSSADTFVTQNMPAASKKENKCYLDRIANAKTYFEGKRIRVFIDELCAVAWLVSSNEADLAGVWIPLQDELLGWGMRREDAALRESVNQVLAGWKRDGTLKSVLSARVPFLDRFQWETP
jgi:ABC-type amino acid transport substrate-binding protein